LGYYSRKTAVLSTDFWLWGELEGTGAEWIDIGLPQPHLFVKTGFGAYIGWRIEGFFATPRNLAFLRDVAERLKATFAAEGARWRWLPFQPTKATNVLPGYYNLRDDIAPVLKSLPSRSKPVKALEYFAKWSFGQASDRASEDAMFDAIRFRVYDFCNANSVNALTYEYVEMVAEEEYNIVGNHNGPSAIKHKAKAIYTWVKKNYRPPQNRNWNWNYKRKTKSDEELQMTRSENITRINKLRALEKKNKVRAAVESLKFLGERISCRKVAEYAGISRNTANKYLRELREEGLI